MERRPIQVQMLGGFSITWGGKTVDDQASRSHKVWLLLAFLICGRDRPVSPDELVELLWREEGANPLNALKTTLHRARACLEPLGERAGYTLILRQEGGFRWNPEFPLSLDAETFAGLCRSQDRPPEQRLGRLLQAVELYRGSFLPKLAQEPWAALAAREYRELYLQAVQEAAGLLEAQGRWKESAGLCRRALLQEPCVQGLSLRLMGALSQLEDWSGVISVYESLRERLLSRFGEMPNREGQELYRHALRQANAGQLSGQDILDRLREAPGPGGALVCGCDLFQMACHLAVRSAGRGEPAHLALISLYSGERPLPQHSLNRAAANLLVLLRESLRRGDLVTQYSPTQFLCLLPQANYSNSRMVCDRVLKAFSRQYPHSPVRLQASVYPLDKQVF